MYIQANVEQYHPARVPRWMIDGRPVSLQQFADEMFPPDSPEKTMFLLKYTKEKL